MMKTLLFIDTNIYLDFYRVRNDVGISLLERLDSIRDQVIVSHQVEMEFKKHRQEAIVESLTKLAPPTSIPRPGVLSDHKSYAALQNDIARCGKRVKNLQKRLQKIFEDPVRHDPVYKVVQRILSKKDDLNLTRDKKVKALIRRRALRRFLSGYPPRKKSDTSMGDAINWEWICEVCEKQKAAVLIVSRDSDYGVTLEKKSYINDWLDTEFRDRVSLQRQIRLTSSLSEALREFNQTVTAEEEEAEAEVINKMKAPPSSDSVLSAEVAAFLKSMGITDARSVKGVATGVF